MVDPSARELGNDAARVRFLLSRQLASVNAYEVLAESLRDNRARAHVLRLLAEEQRHVRETLALLQPGPATPLERSPPRPPSYQPAEAGQVIYSLPAPPSRTQSGLTVGALRGRPEGSG